ncbi:MAG: group 1 truncated hemoglobin [Gemmatimonadota bacterium]|nr:group 1 truncated hemoglobin [Gemmatimonadota bacterium]
METPTLFQRLGGQDGIAAIVDDIVEAHMENPTIGPRFRPYAADPDRLSEIKGHLRTFLSEGSGGPDAYTGRSMPDTHRGMNISVAEYMAAVDDIMDVLVRNEVDESARKDVLAITYALKNEIVHV